MLIPHHMWMTCCIRYKTNSGPLDTTLLYILMAVTYTVVACPTLGSLQTAIVLKTCISSLAVLVVLLRPTSRIAQGNAIVLGPVLVLEAILAGIWDLTIFELALSWPPTARASDLRRTLLFFGSLLVGQVVIPLTLHQAPTHHSLETFVWEPVAHVWTILVYALTRKLLIFCKPSTFAQFAIVMTPEGGGRILSKQKPDPPGTIPRALSLGFFHHCGLLGGIFIAYSLARNTWSWMTHPVTSLRLTMSYVIRVAEAAKTRDRVIRRALQLAISGQPGPLWTFVRERWAESNVTTAVDAWSALVLSFLGVFLTYTFMDLGRSYLRQHLLV